MTANLSIVPQSAEPDLRAALREALEARAAAQSARDKAGAAVVAVDALITKTEGELAGYDDLDERIAGERACIIKAAIDRGVTPVFATSPELRDLSLRRDDGRNRLTAAQSARETLVRELADSETVLRRADLAAREAALPIMAVEVENMTAELLDHEHKAADLRRRVLAYRSLRRSLLGGFDSGQHDWLPLSVETRTALSKPAANAGVEGDLQSSNAWRESFRALLEDADSPLEGLRP